MVEALVAEQAEPALTLSRTHLVVGELAEAVNEIYILEWAWRKPSDERGGPRAEGNPWLLE